MKSLKKIVSLILTIVLVLSVLPLNVFATDNNIVSISISDTYVCDGTQDADGKFHQFSTFITVNHEGGSVGQSIDVYRNQCVETNWGTLNISDNQDSEDWEVGNTYQVAFNIGDFSGTFNVTVLEIESIEVEDVVATEDNNGYMDGYWDADNNYIEWFRYNIEPNNITVNFTNGSYVSGRLYEIQQFISAYPNCYSDQSFENQWGVGEHSATLSLAGFQQEYNVIITASPISAIEVKDLTVYENISYGYETENGYYYHVYPVFNVILADGSRLEECKYGISYGSEYFSLNVSTDQAQDPWRAGNTYTATAKLGGKSCDFNVIVAENPIERIGIKDIILYDGIHNGCGEYYYTPVFDVYLKDGTVYKDNTYSVDFNGICVPLEYTDEQENWKVGNTYNITGTVAGVADTFNVTIKENPIESIEFIKMPKTEYITGEYFDMRSAELRINYTDGKFEDIAINDCIYDMDFFLIWSEYLDTSFECYATQYFSEVGKETVTFQLFGKEIEIDVNVSENLAESAQLKAENDDLVITVKNSDGSSYDLKIVQNDIRAGDVGVGAGWFFAENMIFEAAVYFVYDEDSKTYTDVSFELMNFADEALKTNEIENCEWLKMYDKARAIYWGINFSRKNKLVSYIGDVTKENIDVIMSTAAYLEYGHYMADIELEDGLYYGKFTADEIRTAVYKHFDIDYIDVSLSDKYDSEKDVVYVSNMDAGGPSRVTLNKFANNWYIKFISYDGTIHYVLCDEIGRITAFDTNELYLPDCGYITDKGEYGNIYWQYFEDTKTLKISGKGYIPDFSTSYLAQPWYRYKNEIKRLVIEGDLTAIGNNAFSKITSLSDVVMPDEIEFISSGAFADCVKLSKIVLPKSIKEICENSFKGCKNLSLVNGLENVLSIGESAFEGCALSGTICLNNALYVASDAFCGCTDIVAIKYGLKAYTDVSGDNILPIYVTYGSPLYDNVVFDNKTCFLIGDLSGDGVLNASDIVELMQCILSGNVVDKHISDLNLDGKTDLIDLVRIKKMLANI